MKKQLLALLALCIAAAPASAADRLAGIEIIGSELVIHASSGRTIRGDAVVGGALAMSMDGRSLREVRIDGMARDARAHDDDVFAYDLSVRDAAGNWGPVCNPDPYGERKAILQPAPNGTLAIWCTGGTHAKCIRFGYRPWANGPNGEPLAAYHLACNKMLRADYCGNDQATTRTGMLVDVYDTIGINRPEGDGTPGVSFESAWNAAGAICVAHPRVPQNISLERLVETCPRLKGRLGPVCTEESAASFAKPLLFLASRGDGITEAERGK